MLATSTSNPSPPVVDLFAAERLIERPASPQALLELLQSLSYQCWTKSRISVQIFERPQSKIFRLLLNLLRPRTIDQICSSEALTTNTRKSIWSSTACLVGKAIELWPAQHIKIILAEGTWLPSVLIRKLTENISEASDSTVQQCRGALVALNALAISGQLRDHWIDWAELRPTLYNCLQQSVTLTTSQSTLGRQQPISLRLRLAVWRTAIELCSRMLVEPGVDVFDSTIDSPLTYLGQGLLPLRQDLWHSLFDDERDLSAKDSIMNALLSVLYFIHSQAPRSPVSGELMPLSAAAQSAANANGYPNTLSGSEIVFHNSALHFADLTLPLRSLLHLIQRIIFACPLIQQYLSRNYEFHRCISDLLSLYRRLEAVREDLTQLMMSVGIGRPMNQPAADVANLLFSSVARDVWCGLKSIGHSPPLVGADAMNELMAEGGAEYLMAYLERHSMQQSASEFRNERIGSDFLLQRSIDREASLLRETHSWFTLFRAYSAHIFGQYANAGESYLINVFLKRPEEYCDVLVGMLKNGTDIEQWGAAGAIASILRFDKQIIDESIRERLAKRASFIAIKLLNIRSNHHAGFLAKQQLFTQPQDNQWKFELWHHAIAIINLSVSMVSDIWSGLNQAGMTPAVIGALKHICTIHGIQITNVTGKNVSSSQFARPVREPPVEGLRFTYDSDDTLSSLVYRSIKLMQVLCAKDSFCREIILWDENLALLASFTDFFALDVRRAIKQLATDLALHTDQEIRRIQTNPNNSQPSADQRLGQAVECARSLKSLQNICQENEQAEIFWPAHLVKPHLFCVATGLIPEDLSPTATRTLRTSPYRTHQFVNDERFVSEWRIGRQLEPYLLIKICGNCNAIETRPGQFMEQFDPQQQRGRLFCTKSCWEQLKHGRLLLERQQKTHKKPPIKGLRERIMALFN